MTAAYDGVCGTTYNANTGTYVAVAPCARGKANWSEGLQVYDKSKKYAFEIGDSVFPFGEQWYMIKGYHGGFVGKKVVATVSFEKKDNEVKASQIYAALQKAQKERWPVTIDALDLQSLHHNYYVKSFSQDTIKTIDGVLKAIAQSNVKKMNRSAGGDCLAFMCVIA